MTEVEDWAAEVEAADQKNDNNKVEKNVRPDLPSIPEIFDPETYEPPEPVIIHKGNNIYVKYSWRVVCDSKADSNDENPKMVIEEVVETFRRDTKKVNKKVAMRRRWAKYGMSEFDGDGPNSGTTNMQQDDCEITFLNRALGSQQRRQKPVLSQTEERELQKTKTQIISLLTLHNLTGKSIGEAVVNGSGGPGIFSDRVKAKRDQNGHVNNENHDRPRVGMRDRRDEEGCSVRVSNLNETVTEGDIYDLFGSVGRIRKTYLARDNKNRAKGFAFVTYESKENAQRAIRALNRYRFNYMVLNVELKHEK